MAESVKVLLSISSDTAGVGGASGGGTKRPHQPPAAQPWGRGRGGSRPTRDLVLVVLGEWLLAAPLLPGRRAVLLAGGILAANGLLGIFYQVLGDGPKRAARRGEPQAAPPRETPTHPASAGLGGICPGSCSKRCRDPQAFPSPRLSVPLPPLRAPGLMSFPQKPRLPAGLLKSPRRRARPNPT